MLAVLWFDPRVGALTHKSNVRSVSASIQALVTPGDLVVSTHPEQLPARLVLPAARACGTRTRSGPVADPRVFDWSDCVDRLQDAKPTPTIDRLVRTLEPGQELVLVQPLIRSARWNAPWTSLVRRRSVQWQRRLDADPRMRRVAVVPSSATTRSRGASAPSSIASAVPARRVSGLLGRVSEAGIAADRGKAVGMATTANSLRCPPTPVRATAREDRSPISSSAAARPG